eukprot:Ihof_evm23s22 gene=Ihof_evmTU23s22
MLRRDDPEVVRAQERFQRILKKDLEKEGNKICADCHAKGPRWASWNIGAFVCTNCAGIHRNLGVHISKVKSVNLDKWTAEQLETFQAQGGNNSVNEYYEARLPSYFRRPTASNIQDLEQFIRAKYERKEYLARGGRRNEQDDDYEEEGEYRRTTRGTPRSRDSDRRREPSPERSPVRSRSSRYSDDRRQDYSPAAKTHHRGDKDTYDDRSGRGNYESSYRSSRQESRHGSSGRYERDAVDDYETPRSTGSRSSRTSGNRYEREEPMSSQTRPSPRSHKHDDDYDDYEPPRIAGPRKAGSSRYERSPSSPTRIKMAPKNRRQYDDEDDYEAPRIAGPGRHSSGERQSNKATGASPTTEDNGRSSHQNVAPRGASDLLNLDIPVAPVASAPKNNDIDGLSADFGSMNVQ